jgi:hypothetical protein
VLKVLETRVEEDIAHATLGRAAASIPRMVEPVVVDRSIAIDKIAPWRAQAVAATLEADHWPAVSNASCEFHAASP